jgi:pyruvate/2-oxoglutarate dehydrogenase complex dihydrolipoamide acyltransferase (E2) component
MVTDIRVPKLGMSEEDITVIEFSIDDGQPVNEGELVVIIETAKVSHEIFSPASGLVFHVRVVNDKVGIGSLLAVVADHREEFETYRESLSEDTVQPAPEAPPEVAMEVKEGSPVSTDKEISPLPQPEGDAQEIDGRKVFRKIPYAGMRRTIANNLQSSLQTMAQLTIVSETDMTALSQYRDELMLDFPDTKITFVDILVKLIPTALKEYPIVNSSIHAEEIVCWGEYNIGVAMSLDEGLVVPVIHDADRKSLVQISRQIKSLATKARNKQLTAEHLQGGTFSFSSGGKVETDIITPIIKPPESAILAIGKIGPRPAVYQGQLAIRTMTYLCLTHDHRVIDGVPASLFLGRLKEIIETPALFRSILK